jgi:HEAT repeat protein
MTIVHEEVEAVMQIKKRLDYNSYSDAMDDLMNNKEWDVFSKVVLHEMWVNQYTEQPEAYVLRFNHRIASVFDMMVALQMGRLLDKTKRYYVCLTKKFLDKHPACFDEIFWNAEKRAEAIQKARDNKIVPFFLEAHQGPPNWVIKMEQGEYDEAADRESMERQESEWEIEREREKAKEREIMQRILNELASAEKAADIEHYLTHRDSKVQELTADTLKKMKGFTPELQAIYYAYSGNVNESVKLRSIAVPALIQAIEDRRYIGENVQSLGLIKDVKGLPVLKKLLKIERYYASEILIAMGSVGDKGSLRDIVPFLKDSDERNRDASAKALKKMDEFTPKRQAIYYAYSGNVEESVKLGSVAVPALIQAIEDGRYVGKSVQSLGLIKDIRGLPVVIEKLRQRGDAAVRTLARDALKAMKEYTFSRWAVRNWVAINWALSLLGIAASIAAVYLFGMPIAIVLAVIMALLITAHNIVAGTTYSKAKKQAAIIYEECKKEINEFLLQDKKKHDKEMEKYRSEQTTDVEQNDVVETQDVASVLTGIQNVEKPQYTIQSSHVEKLQKAGDIEGLNTLATTSEDEAERTAALAAIEDIYAKQEIKKNEFMSQVDEFISGHNYEGLTIFMQEQAEEDEVRKYAEDGLVIIEKYLKEIEPALANIKALEEKGAIKDLRTYSTEDPTLLQAAEAALARLEDAIKAAKDEIGQAFNTGNYDNVAKYYESNLPGVSQYAHDEVDLMKDHEGQMKAKIDKITSRGTVGELKPFKKHPYTEVRDYAKAAESQIKAQLKEGKKKIYELAAKGDIDGIGQFLDHCYAGIVEYAKESMRKVSDVISKKQEEIEKAYAAGDLDFIQNVIKEEHAYGIVRSSAEIMINKYTTYVDETKKAIDGMAAELDYEGILKFANDRFEAIRTYAVSANGQVFGSLIAGIQNPELQDDKRIEYVHKLAHIVTPETLAALIAASENEVKLVKERRGSAKVHVEILKAIADLRRAGIGDNKILPSSGMKLNIHAWPIAVVGILGILAAHSLQAFWIGAGVMAAAGLAYFLIKKWRNMKGSIRPVVLTAMGVIAIGMTVGLVSCEDPLDDVDPDTGIVDDSDGDEIVLPELPSAPPIFMGNLIRSIVLSNNNYNADTISDDILKLTSMSDESPMRENLLFSSPFNVPAGNDTLRLVVYARDSVNVSLLFHKKDGLPSYLSFEFTTKKDSLNWQVFDLPFNNTSGYTDISSVYVKIEGKGDVFLGGMFFVGPVLNEIPALPFDTRIQDEILGGSYVYYIDGNDKQIRLTYDNDSLHYMPANTDVFAKLGSHEVQYLGMYDGLKAQVYTQYDSEFSVRLLNIDGDVIYEGTKQIYGGTWQICSFDFAKNLAEPIYSVVFRSKSSFVYIAGVGYGDVRFDLNSLRSFEQNGDAVSLIPLVDFPLGDDIEILEEGILKLNKSITIKTSRLINLCDYDSIGLAMMPTVTTPEKTSVSIRFKANGEYVTAAVWSSFHLFPSSYPERTTGWKFINEEFARDDKLALFDEIEIINQYDEPVYIGAVILYKAALPSYPVVKNDPDLLKLWDINGDYAGYTSDGALRIKRYKSVEGTLKTPVILRGDYDKLVFDIYTPIKSFKGVDLLATQYDDVDAVGLEGAGMYQGDQLAYIGHYNREFSWTKEEMSMYGYVDFYGDFSSDEERMSYMVGKPFDLLRLYHITFWDHEIPQSDLFIKSIYFKKYDAPQIIAGQEKGAFIADYISSASSSENIEFLKLDDGGIKITRIGEDPKNTSVRINMQSIQCEDRYVSLRIRMKTPNYFIYPKLDFIGGGVSVRGTQSSKVVNGEEIRFINVDLKDLQHIDEMQINDVDAVIWLHDMWFVDADGNEYPVLKPVSNGSKSASSSGNLNSHAWLAAVPFALAFIFSLSHTAGWIAVAAGMVLYLMHLFPKYSKKAAFNLLFLLSIMGLSTCGTKKQGDDKAKDQKELVDETDLVRRQGIVLIKQAQREIKDNDFDNAYLTLAKVLTTDDMPKDLFYYAQYMIAVAMSMQDNYTGAIEMYTNCIEGAASWEPDSAFLSDIYRLRGGLYYKMKDDARAIDDLKKALAYSSKDSEYYESVVLMLQILGVHELDMGMKDVPQTDEYPSRVPDSEVKEYYLEISGVLRGIDYSPRMDKKRAVQALYSYRDDNIVDIMRSDYWTIYTPNDYRLMLIEAFKRIGSAKAIAALQGIVEDSHDPDIRNAANAAIKAIDPNHTYNKELPFDEYVREYVRKLNDAYSDLGRGMIEREMKYLDQRAVQILMDEYSKVESIDVRISIIKVLAGLGDQSAEKMLIDLSKNDPDERIQETAKEQLEVLQRYYSLIEVAPAAVETWPNEPLARGSATINGVEYEYFIDSALKRLGEYRDGKLYLSPYAEKKAIIRDGVIIHETVHKTLDGKGYSAAVEDVIAGTVEMRSVIDASYKKDEQEGMPLGTTLQATVNFLYNEKAVVFQPLKRVLNQFNDVKGAPLDKQIQVVAQLAAMQHGVGAIDLNVADVGAEIEALETRLLGAVVTEDLANYTEAVLQASANEVTALITEPEMNERVVILDGADELDTELISKIVDNKQRLLYVMDRSEGKNMLVQVRIDQGIVSLDVAAGIVVDDLKQAVGIFRVDGKHVSVISPNNRELAKIDGKDALLFTTKQLKEGALQAVPFEMMILPYAFKFSAEEFEKNMTIHGVNKLFVKHGKFVHVNLSYMINNFGNTMNEAFRHVMDVLGKAMSLNMAQNMVRIAA